MNKPTRLLVTLSVALLAACGQKDSTAPALTPTPVAAPAPVVENTVGKSVFGRVCSMCHAIGAGGAPKPGDKADWGPRIAQGMDTLHKHALQGFQGKAGYMPPKGGRTDLSDQSVMNGVDYIVAAGK